MKILSDPPVKTEIIERLSRLTPNSPRQWGKMTPSEMICHLSDSYYLVVSEMSTSVTSNIFGRTVMKWGALRVPMKWPPGVKTVPELDQSIGAGTAPTDFEADRQRLLAFIGRFTAPNRDFTFAPHPIFGPLTEWEWMRWAYLHADHHLRQFGV